MRFVNPLPLLLGLGLLLSGANALALPTDRDQPVRIQADSAELDEGKGVAVYRGNVIITQGSLKITGDAVTISQNRQKEDDVFTATGKPAQYEQKPAADKSAVRASGMTIQYFAASERIVLIDRAKIVQAGNTFEGEKIVYDVRKQIVNAGRAGSESVSAPRSRIDMVIQPRTRTEASGQ